MHTHDYDSPLSERHEPVPRREDVSPVVSRAVATGRSDPLDVGSVLELQRSAGNNGVASWLDEEPDDESRSPVLDVVGSGVGSPLDAGTRSFMETSLGHDFSDVRIHTDGAATESARSVGAHAYTVGSDVVVQSDHWAPDTDAGKRMLAHELTHVVQQKAGPVDGTPATGGIQVSDPSDRFEQAAERTADAVMSGDHTPETMAAATSAAPGVQRQESEEEPEELQGSFVQRMTEEEDLEEEPEVPG